MPTVSTLAASPASGLVEAGPGGPGRAVGVLAGGAGDRVLPSGSGAGPEVLAVAEHLDALLPWGGLRLGETVAVSGSSSLALTLIARASAAGAWCAVVDVPTLGLAAAREAGVDLDRLAIVPFAGERWPEVVAALVDALDIVVLGLAAPVPGALARRLQDRVRRNGAVLLTLHRPGVPVLDRTQLRLTVTSQQAEGLGDGHGHLRRRRLQVRVEGRGAAARARTLRLCIPAEGETADMGADAGAGVGAASGDVSAVRVAG